jgi:large subunit ribosomal protein L19e
MNLKNQKRLAAAVLDVGVNRIYIDPEGALEVEAAITRQEIRKLIKDGVIKAIPVNSTSRGRARDRMAQKKAKRRGPNTPWSHGRPVGWAGSEPRGDGSSG